MPADYQMTSLGFRKVPTSSRIIHRPISSSKPNQGGGMRKERKISLPSNIVAETPLSLRKKRVTQSIRLSPCLDKYKADYKKQSVIIHKNLTSFREYDKSDKTIYYNKRKSVTSTTSVSRSETPRIQQYEELTGNQVYTVRNRSCIPHEMYLHEGLRQCAKRQGSHERRCYSAGVALKFQKHEQQRQRNKTSSLKDKEFFHHEDFTMGQKQYIWGIARCYSVDDFKKASERRHRDILDYELQKRLKTRSISEKTKIKLRKDYCDYSKIIDKIAGKSMSPRPTSSFSRRVLYGHENHDVHLRPNTAPDHMNFMIDHVHNAQNEEHINYQAIPRNRPKSARWRSYSAPSPSPSIEDELIFDTNEKLFITDERTESE